MELHLAIWDDFDHRVLLRGSPALTIDAAQTRLWAGRKFPVLDDADAFLLQVSHVFNHMLSYWIKLSWLLEIGCFLRARSRDSVFWQKLNEKIEKSPYLMELSGFTVDLVLRLFSPPAPAIACGWSRALRPAARLWLARYSEDWVFGEHPIHELGLFPTSKLSLFLHQEYIPDLRIRRDLLLRRLIPWKRPPKLFSPAGNHLSTRMQALSSQSIFTIRKSLFHLGAGGRYLWEWPRWRSLMRSQAREAPLQSPMEARASSPVRNSAEDRTTESRSEASVSSAPPIGSRRTG